MEVARIRIVRDDVAIWLVYAGRGRRFFELFRETGSVFLSLPGFSATDRVFSSDELLRRHLAMSDEINRWVSGARNDAPSRRPRDYNPYPYKSGSAEAKSFAAELGNIQRMFIDAKVGDIVLSPPYGHFEPFLVGEITHHWRKVDDLAVPILEGEEVPARKVRWLNTALARRDFPPRVSRRLQNQHAITRLDPAFTEDVIRLVYPSFVWGEQSKLDIYGVDYTGTDPLQPYAPALLIKYVLASVFAYEGGQLDAFQALPPLQAIEQFYREDLVEHFGQNFNSPGKFSVVAALGSLSVLASAGMLVATADPNSSFSQTKAEAVDKVKDAMKGAGKANLEIELDNYVKSMESVNWKDVQKNLGKPATDSMKLTMDNRAEVANHRAELSAK